MQACSTMFTPISCLFKLHCTYAGRDSWPCQLAAGPSGYRRNTVASTEHQGADPGPVPVALKQKSPHAELNPGLMRWLAHSNKFVYLKIHLNECPALQQFGPRNARETSRLWKHVFCRCLVQRGTHLNTDSRSANQRGKASERCAQSEGGKTKDLTDYFCSSPEVINNQSSLVHVLFRVTRKMQDSPPIYTAGFVLPDHSQMTLAKGSRALAFSPAGFFTLHTDLRSALFKVNSKLQRYETGGETGGRM